MNCQQELTDRLAVFHPGYTNPLLLGKGFHLFAPCFIPDFLLDLLFYPEDGGNTLFRNID
jgi:hypothetical protein